MRCVFCDQKIPSDSEFCQFCGMRLTKEEPDSAAPNPDLISAEKTVKIVAEQTPNPPNKVKTPMFKSKLFWKIVLSITLVISLGLNIIIVSFLGEIKTTLNTILLQQTTSPYSNADTCVYIYAENEYYHAHKKCLRFKNVFEITLEDAVGRGYSPCKWCDPEILH